MTDFDHAEAHLTDEQRAQVRAAVSRYDEVQANPGTLAARLSYLLAELDKRFPGVVNPVLSDPPEPKLLAAIDALLAADVQAPISPVGEAANMPGAEGFTMACFNASDVPCGTALAAPTLPAAQEKEA